MLERVSIVFTEKCSKEDQGRSGAKSEKVNTMENNFKR